MLARKFLSPSLSCTLALLIFITVFYLVGIERLRPDVLYNHHQAVNSWKIYQIEKNKLNPLSYDIKLLDLSGGRFASFWDPPLPYLVSLVLSKALFFLGDLKFLAAVRLTTHLNFFLSILSFFFLLQAFRINRLVSFVFTFLLFTHRQITTAVGFLSFNLPSLWALIIPLHCFFLLEKKPRARNYTLFGLALGLSFLQNPYYGFFVSAFLLIPLGAHFFASRKLLKRILSVAFSGLACLSLILLLKGPDLYKIAKERPADPESRDYIFKQLRVYRPWYHVIPPYDHPLFRGVSESQTRFLKDLIARKTFDLLTLWPPESDNQSYLGFFNLIFFAFLSARYIQSCDRRKVRALLVFLGAYLFMMAVNFRADIFLQSRHFIFPWYRLQVLLPFTQLKYVATLVVILFYFCLAILFDRLLLPYFSGIKRKLVRLPFLFAIIGFLGIGFYDTAYREPGPSCIPKEDRDLTSYLNSSKANRLFIHISGDCHSETGLYFGKETLNQPISWDARYYQIFHKSPIYAPNSFSWFDNYRYDDPLRSLRTLNSILTDNNNQRLIDLGVDEIVLFTEFTDAKDYWDSFLSLRYKSRKPHKVFGQSIVFLVK